MYTRPFFIICFLSLLLAGSIQAQNGPKFRVALTSEIIGLPFSNFDLNNLGIELGYGIKSIEKEKSTRQIYLNVGAYFHKDFSNTYYVLPSYEHPIKIANGFHLLLEGGIGIQLFQTNWNSFVFEDGRYKSDGRHNQISTFAKLNSGLRYQLSDNTAPYLSYGLVVDYPFAPAGGLPVLPHSLLQVGINHQF